MNAVDIRKDNAFDNVKAGRLLISNLKLLGLWHYDDSTWNVVYHLYGWILHVLFTFLFIFGMFVNVALSKSMVELSDALYMALTEAALFVKALTFLRNSKAIRDLFVMYEREEIGLPVTKKEEEMLNRLHVEYSRLRNSHSIGSFVVVCWSCLVAFLARNLPFPCWIPFDYKTDPSFLFAYSYVTIGISVTAFTNVTIDLSQAYFLFQVSNYYRLLGMRFCNFGYDLQAPDKDLQHLIEFHNFIKKLTERSEKLISLPVLVQICLSALIICVTAYKINTINFLEDPSKVAILIIFALIMCLQIYLPCKYGNDLSVSASELIDCVYKSNWINLPLKTKKHIYIYMESMKKPIVVKAGNFFQVGLGVFTQTMNNAYRIYAVLMNMNK